VGHSFLFGLEEVLCPPGPLLDFPFAIRYRCPGRDEMPCEGERIAPGSALLAGGFFSYPLLARFHVEVRDA